MKTNNLRSNNAIYWLILLVICVFNLYIRQITVFSRKGAWTITTNCNCKRPERFHFTAFHNSQSYFASLFRCVGFSHVMKLEDSLKLVVLSGRINFWLHLLKLPKSSTAGGWPKIEDRRPTGLKQRPAGLKRRPTGLKRRPAGLTRRPTGLKRRPAGLKRRPTVLKPFFFSGKDYTLSSLSVALTRDQAQLYHRSFVFLARRSLQLGLIQSLTGLCVFVRNLDEIWLADSITGSHFNDTS